MKKLIFIIIWLSVFFSCNILKEGSDSQIFTSTYNGLYSVITSGAKFYYYNDSTDFVFVDTNALIDVSEIKSMKKKKNKLTRSSELHIEFTEAGAEKFYKYTKDHIGDAVAIIFGDRLLSAPIIQQEIAGGKVVVTAYDTDFIDEIIDAFNKLKK